MTQGVPINISISDNFAEDANLKVGDPIVFNIQGVLMETIVGSIRKVDWSSMKVNFMILFPTGVLENAPQFNVMTTHVPNKEGSAELQRALVQEFPNVTILDLRQVFTIVEDILDKISWIINFMAFFSILTGFIVLIGSVRNSKYQRIKESVLLRTLGAKEIRVIAPRTLLPARIESLGVKVFHKIEDGLKDADVIVMLRLQKERMQGALLPSEHEYFNLFGLTKERVALATKDAIVMHPGPINRGVEISSEVADGSQSVILDQVSYSIAVRMAIMSMLAGHQP